ncbi:MAG: bacteriohemerythrin [Candidatus Latescibacterota bacterium]
MKLNCWEFKGCGRGPGGERVAESGLCATAEASEFDGRNGGHLGGRYCWKVLGTECDGVRQETLSDKLTTCSRCGFYRQLRQEADPDQEVSLLWSPALEFGIPLIDGQHRRLVSHLEDILAAAGDGGPAVTRCLQFLTKYTREHFQTEERFMAEHGFPGLRAHAAAHAAFRASMVKVGKLVSGTQDPAEYARLIKSMMVNWYADHITRMDQEYSRFFHSRNVAHLIR